MKRARPIGRVFLTLFLAVPLLVAGCGRRGDPGPPEGRESEFVYPGTYPYPDLVVPRDEAREPVPPAPAQSIFRREKTTVYGPLETQ